MLIIAICLFASAAAAGLFMALRILTNKAAPPLAVALVHGVAGAAGLAVLLLAVMSMDGFGAPGLALTVLGTNAVLGFYLFSCHLRRRPWPKPFVLLHGAAALTGFGILLYFLVTSSE
jgi:hypothetical protein